MRNSGLWLVLGTLTVSEHQAGQNSCVNRCQERTTDYQLYSCSCDSHCSAYSEGLSCCCSDYYSVCQSQTQSYQLVIVKVRSQCEWHVGHELKPEILIEAPQKVCTRVRYGDLFTFHGARRYP